MGTRPDNSSSIYRVFISFTGADKELAEYLASELRRILEDYSAVYCFTLPGTHDSLAGSRPSDDFEKLIDDRLRKCNVFILLWSEAARRQNWINYELTHAKRLLIQKVKRGGKEFKIIPISINKCSIPFGLSHLVRAAYTSGGDLQVTLNQVLHALGLQAEHGDPYEIFLKKAIFEVKTAFGHHEWSVVVQKYRILAREHPTVISAPIHYRYAIALLNLEQTEYSLMAMYEGLKLDNKEEDTAFIELYTQHLKEKRLWKEVLSLAEKAIAMFPSDARWHQLKWDMMNRINDASSFFLPPNHQAIQQLRQTISVGSNGTNRTAMPITDAQNASFVPIQQFPSLFQSNFVPNAHNVSSAQQLDSQVPDMTTVQASSDQQQHVTRRLSVEELQPEIEDGSCQETNGFAENHISHHKIERLLETPMIFIAVLNILYVALVSLFLSLNEQTIIAEVLGVLIILYLGRFIDLERIKLICIGLLAVFWVISGYSFGYHLYGYLGWGTENSLGICMGMAFSVIIVSVGGRFHLRLFHSEE